MKILLAAILAGVCFICTAVYAEEECGTGGCYSNPIKLNDQLSVRFFHYLGGGFLGQSDDGRITVQFWSPSCVLKPFDFQIQYTGEGYDDSGNYHDEMPVTEKYRTEPFSSKFWADAIPGSDHGSVLTKDDRNPVVTILSPLECEQGKK